MNKYKFGLILLFESFLSHITLLFQMYYHKRIPAKVFSYLDIKEHLYSQINELCASIIADDVWHGMAFNN